MMKIQSLYSSLNSDITDEQILIDILMSINEVEKISIDVSIKFYKIQEHFHELRMQNLKVNPTQLYLHCDCKNNSVILQVVDEDIRAFSSVKSLWEKVYDRCLYKKFILESVKISTVNIMKVKLETFVSKCDQFVTHYNENKNKLLSSEFDTTVEMLMVTSTPVKFLKTN